jgi:rare lipoprotein A
MNGTIRNILTAVAVALLVAAFSVHAADDAQKAPPSATPPGPAANPAVPSPAEPAAPAATSAPATSAETGLAAVYNHRLNGHKTASGERYDANQLTAAHKTLPYGTKVKITNVKNHKSVTVRINDRGPTQEGRILDVSSAAAKQLGIGPRAMAEVTAETVEK